MIKQTLYFGNPSYLSLHLNQLVIKKPNNDEIITRPIEDIGLIVLDNKQITITQGLIAALLDNNCSIVTCNSHSMPTGLLLPLDCNSVQHERFQHQLSASLPLRKQLWQQTIKSKIENQAKVLSLYTKSEVKCMYKWSNDVKSGDHNNLEARAAAYYWKNLFSNITELNNFTRNREGVPPNNLLNYGYAILRAVVARALVSSGLLPTFGIHHHNRYNAYCLADDIMEPYRPYVDELVYNIVSDKGINNIYLDNKTKSKLLSIPAIDVVIADKRSPLMIAVSQTTASVYKCFSGELRNIIYPTR